MEEFEDMLDDAQGGGKPSFNDLQNDIEYIKGENEEFDEYFKWIGGIVGLDITYNDELEARGKEYLSDNFSGVYSYDKIPVLKVGQCAILNNKPHTHEGEHWVGIVRYSENEYLFYDSYGRNYEELIPTLKKYLRDKNANIFSTKTVRQRGNEEFCGASTLAWLIYVYDQPNPMMGLII